MMKSKLSAVLLGASLFIGGMTALSSPAAAQTAPIQIEQLHTYGGFYEDADHDVNVLPASLEITFENLSNADATDVVFEAEADGYIARFNDVGRFSKGIRIRHSFPVNPFSVSAKFSVRVIQVSFADGTVWQNAATSPNP
ncbi:MAG: hypothetical protein ABSH03_12570 [Candidatus Lustribacter sp.]